MVGERRWHGRWQIPWIGIHGNFTIEDECTYDGLYILKNCNLNALFIGLYMIHVVAIITTKPGKRDDVLSNFSEIIPTVLQEEGCIEYGPTIDAAGAPSIQTPFGSNTFVVIEKWSSLATLDAHSKSKHMIAYGEKVKPLIEDRIIHVLTAAL